MEPDSKIPPSRRFIDPSVAPLADTLDGVRQQIDGIDDALVDLLAERLCWVRDATRFKAVDDEVAAPSRQEAVFARAKDAARRRAPDLDGLELVIDATFRAMVAACIAQQARWFERTEPLA